jgi:hypothetical protein
VSAADAFALSILFAGLGIIGNLPGGILYAAGKRAASDKLEVGSQKPESRLAKASREGAKIAKKDIN